MKVDKMGNVIVPNVLFISEIKVIKKLEIYRDG